MKIGKLILENFAAIYSGMKTNRIEIDLLDAPNAITLLLGPNGSGKTAIESTMHPFAYAGSMDIRNSLDIILEGEDGYKEIHIWKEDVCYIVKHFYKETKTGRSVKSFIMRDTDELNPNGNVSSFKEIVNCELGLYEDFMRLIRLGSNVVNFADMKSTERKEYATELMADIDLCGKYYRKINDDSKFLKSSLATVAKKLEKLNIVDLETEYAKIDDLSNKKIELQELVKTIERDKWTIEEKIKSAMPNGVDVFRNEINILEENLRENIRQMKMINSELNRCGDFSNVSDKELKKSEKRKDIITNKLVGDRALLKANLSSLDRLNSSKDSRMSQLAYLKSESELEDIKSTFNNNKERIASLNNEYNFSNIQFKCTKSDLLIALSLLQEIDKLAQDIYALGTDSVKASIDMLTRGKNIEGFVAHKVADIDEKLSSISKIEVNTKDDGSIQIMYVPEECLATECPYYNMYHKEDVDKKTVQDKILKLENEREYYISMKEIGAKIDFIFMIIKSNNSLISKMPEKFFEIGYILTQINNFLPIYEEEKVSKYISILEDYELYNSLISENQSLERELELLQRSNDSAKIVQEEFNQIVLEIRKIEDENKLFKENIEDNELEKEEIEKFINNVILFRELKERYTQLESESVGQNFELSSKKEILNNMMSTIERDQETKQKLSKLVDMIQSIDDTINNLNYNIKDFKNLNKEVAKINSKFEDIEYIKKALSTREGIPLLFVQMYFKDTRRIVNKLLSAINLEIEIADFEIDDKKFEIPYYKRNTKISDIMYASDGEKAFFNIALSFALIIQSKSPYNIILIDEIDGPLDSSNRKAFLDIIETQMSSIGAEQLFIITHNNQFSNYPCNAIICDDTYSTEDYNNLASIPIKKR